jgi:hypothetical protein
MKLLALLFVFLLPTAAHAFVNTYDLEPTKIEWQGRSITLIKPPIVKGGYALFAGYAWTKNDTSTPRIGDAYLYNMSNKDLVALSDNQELTYIGIVGFSDDGVITWETFSPDYGTHNYSYTINSFDNNKEANGVIVGDPYSDYEGVAQHYELSRETVVTPELPSWLLLVLGVVGFMVVERVRLL